MKVYCKKCKYILGPPHMKKDESLCCATETPMTLDESDWYEEKLMILAENRVLCSQRNMLNNCVYYEEQDES